MALKVSVTKQLEHFSLETEMSCPAGRLTAIIGPSGAGKTTLMRVIAGLEQPDSGTISLNDTIWFDSVTRQSLPVRERKIGLVFQDYTLFPHMTVRQNIKFGAQSPEDIPSLMHRFGIAHLADSRPGGISGGERQRAAFCQALASKPRLLLLDEPFSALDVKTRASLCDLLVDLKNDLGIPILHVTHDLEEAARLADNVISMDHGRISPDWISDTAVPPQLNTQTISPAYM